MISRFHSALIFSSCAFLALAACNSGTPLEKGDSEELLSAHGPYALVEEEKQVNPLEQHMAARGQVDPSPQSDTTKYTSKAKSESEPVHFRVLKLESQMSGLQGDFNKLLGPLSKVETEDDQLSKTVDEIKARQKIAAEQNMAAYGSAPPPVPVEITAPPAIPPSETVVEIKTTDKPIVTVPKEAPAKKDDATPNGTRVTGVRVGEHPGKVRIVLDVTGPVKFSADLDNAEKLLLVDLPGAAWEAGMKQSLKSPLIKGYSAQENAGGGGTTLAIELTGPSKLLMKTALEPNTTYGHRIVLDIAAE